MMLYRIQLTHEDADHPNAAPSHWGPVYDDAYAAVLGDAGMAQDLLNAAQNGLARCLAENPEAQGFSAKIVTLSEDGYWSEVV